MRKNQRMDYEERESFSPWEVYSDLYCGLLLVFVLLFFFAIYQYIAAMETNNADTAALQQSMKEEQASVLALYKADLDNQLAAYQEKEQELESQSSVLALYKADLENQQAVVEEQKAEISTQQVSLTEQQEQLAAQQELLKQQQTSMEEQQTIVEEQAQLLKEQAEQIESIVGVRTELIEALNTELRANGIQIQADQTSGAIIFESEILFDVNSNELSDSGKDFFKRFIPVYMETLLKPEFQDYIAEVIVEGHTDTDGTYLHNLELSQDRAWSVAEYIMNEESKILKSEEHKILKTLLTVNGCADRSPIYREDGTVDDSKSRRVEIKFRMKDEEMLQEMEALLTE